MGDKMEDEAGAGAGTDVVLGVDTLKTATVPFIARPVLFENVKL